MISRYHEVSLDPMRAYKGKILLRLPPDIHEELAREAFESGRSISELCMQAILARRALKEYDPWKGIAANWARNRKVDPVKLNADIREAIREVRRARRAR